MMKPPFEIYEGSYIADANGHICTAESPELAREILAALNNDHAQKALGRDLSFS